MISTTANAASQRQCGRSVPSWRRLIATGSSSTAPIPTRASTSTGTATPPSATLISRYGMPQMRLIAANSAQPRRLTGVLPPVGTVLHQHRASIAAFPQDHQTMSDRSQCMTLLAAR